jgi:hypothetical protein
VRLEATGLGKLLAEVGILTLEGLQLGQHGGVLAPELGYLVDELIKAIGASWGGIPSPGGHGGRLGKGTTAAPASAGSWRH